MGFMSVILGSFVIVVALFRHKWSFTFLLLLRGQYMWEFRLFFIRLFRYIQALLPQCIGALELIQLFRQSFTLKFIAQLSMGLAFIWFSQLKLFSLLHKELISRYKLGFIFQQSFKPQPIGFSTLIFIQSFRLRQFFILFFTLKLRRFFQFTFQLQLFSTLILFFQFKQFSLLLFILRQFFKLQLQWFFRQSLLQELLLFFIQFFRLQLIFQPQLKLFSTLVLKQSFLDKQFFLQVFLFRWIFRFR